MQVALQGTPKPIHGTLHNQQLRRLRQTKCLMDCYSRPAAERRSRSRSYPRKSGILQSSLPGSKTRQPLEASYRLEFTKQISGHPKVQDGDPECIRASLRKGEWVTSIDLTYVYLHVPIHTQSQKYLRFHFKGVTYQFTSLPFGLATAPLIFTSIVTEVKLMALQSGIRLHQYLDDWLICAPSEQQCTVQTQKLLKLVKDLGFIVNLKTSELKPSQRFNFLGYHFLLDLALVKPTQDRWTKLQEMFHCLSLKSVISARTLMSTIGLLASTEKTVKLGRMHMRPFQWHLKTHWKYPMPLDTLIPWNQKMIRHREWWLDPQNVLQGEHLHPKEHEKLIFTDASNAGWGTHSGQNSTGGLWSLSEKHLHINLLDMKAVLLALQFFKTDCRNDQVLIASDNTLSGGLYQQTGRHKISRTLCPNVENSHLVSPKQRHTQSKTCTGLTQCDSGRHLKEEPDPINRVVPFSTNFQTNFQTLGESPSGPVRNQPEQNASYICLSDPGSSGMGSRCPQHSMGKPGCLRVPSHRPAAQGCTKTSIKNMQDNSDSPRLADKTMVLGPGGDVSGHSKTGTTHTHSAKTTTEQPLPCQPNIPEPPPLVSRSSALQEHGFTARSGRKNCCSSETLNKIHLHIQVDRLYRKTGGLQESLYRRHLQLLLVSVQ